MSYNIFIFNFLRSLTISSNMMIPLILSKPRTGTLYCSFFFRRNSVLFLLWYIQPNTYKQHFFNLRNQLINKVYLYVLFYKYFIYKHGHLLFIWSNIRKSKKYLWGHTIGFIIYENYLLLQKGIICKYLINSVQLEKIQ